MDTSRAYLLASVFGLGAVGCQGLKFVPEPMNAVMPADVVNRTHLTSSAGYQANLSALAGHVLNVPKQDGQCPDFSRTVPEVSGVDVTVDSYVKNGEELKPTLSATPRYNSKIDHRVAKSLSITPAVAQLAANLSENQATEVIMTEISVVVRDEQIDLPKLRTLANQALPANICERFFIRNVTLESLVYKDYTETAADATAAGTAFKGETKVFSSTAQFSLAYDIGLDLQRVRAGGPLAVFGGAPGPIARLIRVPEGGFPTR